MTPVPEFTVSVYLPVDRQEAWDRLWHLDRHSAAVPLTTVRSLDGAPLRGGSRFVARTSLGPMVVDDVMQVEQWDPPRRAVVRKQGRVLTGAVVVEVVSAPGGSRVEWHQTYGARAVPDVVASWARRPVRRGYRRSLRQILR